MDLHFPVSNLCVSIAVGISVKADDLWRGSVGVLKQRWMTDYVQNMTEWIIRIYKYI